MRLLELFRFLETRPAPQTTTPADGRPVPAPGDR
jgi:hypothetical protein